ncbi:hypothetical protein B9Z55_021875 [Caenorhabditis nigoni]|uniref:Uncharacterized protein n=1 Tax=Caenorhabditis nigoni TaxID=1611254 RepID=A0A2G5TUH2_9PELO|nr:hypothetical protein B9Z55_021875 [Caenorhabditis nigoni]
MCFFHNKNAKTIKFSVFYAFLNTFFCKDQHQHCNLAILTARRQTPAPFSSVADDSAPGVLVDSVVLPVLALDALALAADSVGPHVPADLDDFAALAALTGPLVCVVPGAPADHFAPVGPPPAAVPVGQSVQSVQEC